MYIDNIKISLKEYIEKNITDKTTFCIYKAMNGKIYRKLKDCDHFQYISEYSLEESFEIKFEYYFNSCYKLGKLI